MISEGSCDTEGWCNEALHHRNKLHKKNMSIENSKFKIVTIFHNTHVLLINQKQS